MQTHSTSETADGPKLPRIVAGILAILAAPSAARDLYGMSRGEFDPLLAVFGGCTTLFVALCTWFAMRGHRARSRAHMKLVLRSGLVVGAIGFSIGFFGPMIWSPGANQGPMLGIFLTGPIGLVTGALGGWLYARARTSRLPRDSSAPDVPPGLLTLPPRETLRFS